MPNTKIAITLGPSTDPSGTLRRLMRAGAGDTVAFVAGQPIGRAGTTNLMKLQRIGET